MPVLKERTDDRTGRVMTFAVCSCGIAVAMMHTLVIPLLPAFPRLLGVSAADVSWLVTATLLAGAVSAPIFGRLGDLFGRRRILSVVLGLMLAGSVLGAVSWSYLPLLIGRTLQGAALGAIPLGISLLKERLPAHRAGSGVAMMSATLGIGGAIGLPLAGLLTQIADWHGVFWVAGGISLTTLLLTLRFVPESSNQASGRFDLVGALGLSATLISLLLGISRGATWGWASGRTLAAFTASAVLLVVWVVYELRVTAPLVNVRASMRPTVLLTNLSAVLLGMAMFTSFVMIGQRLQAPAVTGYGHGLSTLAAGLCMAPSGLMMLVFAPLSARLSAARGAPTTLLLGCLILLAANLAQATLPGSITLVVANVALTATGTALAYSAMPTVIMTQTAPTETAAANSLNTVMRTIGTSTCSAACGALLVSFTTSTNGRQFPAATAYTAAFGIAAASAGVAAILATALIVMRARTHSTEPSRHPAPTSAAITPRARHDSPHPRRTSFGDNEIRLIAEPANFRRAKSSDMRPVTVRSPSG